MPTQQLAEIKSTLSIFRTMIASHEAARERLTQRKKDASWDSARVAKALEVNAHTLRVLRHAVSALEQQLHDLQNTKVIRESEQVQRIGEN